MAGRTTAPVTMRVKIGDAELEVSGPAKFVEEKVAAFVTEHGTRRTSTEKSSSGSSAKKASTLAQLLKKVSVKSDVERVLVAGYYLETAQDMQKFTAGELKDVIRMAKIKPPNNPSDVVAKNIKKGLMMQAGDKEGRMAYVLTTDGTEFVEEQLKA